MLLEWGCEASIEQESNAFSYEFIEKKRVGSNGKPNPRGKHTSNYRALEEPEKANTSNSDVQRNL